VEDGGGRQRWWLTMTTAMADDDNGDSGRQRRQTITAADSDGTWDQVVDYKGEGGERAANNNSIKARRAESMNK
jgi:hypothetical protein